MLQMDSKVKNKISSLPLKGKKVFKKAYDFSLDKGFDSSKAFDNGLKAVNNLYKYSGDTWVSYQDVTMNTVLSKEGGFFNSNYYFDATLTADSPDEQGNTVSKSFLKYMVDKGIIDDDGDIFHNEIKGDVGYKGVFKKIKQVFNDNRVDFRFILNKSHPKYKDVLKKVKSANGSYGVSAEFYNPKLVGDKIVMANAVGWTLTDKPSNKDAKVFGRKSIE